MERTMTPSSRPDQSFRRASHRRGFTLVELLVVMGIILVLISILLPALNRAHHQAIRHSMMADLQIISQGLDAYRNDFGDYPRTGLASCISSPGTLGSSTTPVTGAAVLCWALAGPGPALQDGAGMMSGVTPLAGTGDLGAPGFRPHIAGQGRIYGPYISLDQFRIGNIATATGSNPPPNNAVNGPNVGPNTLTYYDDTTCVLADRYGNIILYFPGNTNLNPRTGGAGGTPPGLLGSWAIGTTPPAGSNAVYNYNDNSTPVTAGSVSYPPYITPISTNTINVGQSTLTPKVMAYRLGHTSALSGTATGPVAASEVPVIVPYLLWSAGPDGQFGPQVNTSGLTTGEDDDVVYPPDQLLDFPTGQQLP